MKEQKQNRGNFFAATLARLMLVLPAACACCAGCAGISGRPVSQPPDIMDADVKLRELRLLVEKLRHKHPSAEAVTYAVVVGLSSDCLEYLGTFGTKDDPPDGSFEIIYSDAQLPTALDAVVTEVVYGEQKHFRSWTTLYGWASGTWSPRVPSGEPRSRTGTGGSGQ